MQFIEYVVIRRITTCSRFKVELLNDKISPLSILYAFDKFQILQNTFQIRSTNYY